MNNFFKKRKGVDLGVGKDKVGVIICQEGAVHEIKLTCKLDNYFVYNQFINNHMSQNYQFPSSMISTLFGE